MLVLQPILCPEIHGDSGLDGPEGRALLPSGGKLAQPGKAVLHMYSYIMEAFRQGYASQLHVTQVPLCSHLGGAAIH